MTLESPLDSTEIKPVSPKGNQSWIFIGRTDAEAKAPILWLSKAKNWLIEKDPDAGKDWRQEEKRATEDKTVGWHHRLYGHEFEQASKVDDGQGSLVCCSPWGCKELDTTEPLNWARNSPGNNSYIVSYPQLDWGNAQTGTLACVSLRLTLQSLHMGSSTSKNARCPQLLCPLFSASLCPAPIVPLKPTLILKLLQF